MVTSQKKNLIISVSVVLAIGFLSISFVSYYIGLNELRNKIVKNELPLSVDSIYHDIRDELQRPIYISSFMGNDYFLKKWVMDGEKDKESVVQYLKDIKKEYSALTSYFVSAKSLNYYHPSKRVVTLDKNDPKNAWFFYVRDHVSEYQVNIDNDYLNSDLLTIFINYKMKGPNDEFLGVVGIGIEVDVAKSFIDRSSQYFNHDIYFLDRKGSVKLSSKNVRNPFENLYDFSPLSSQADKILSGARGIYEYETDNGMHYVTTRYIKEFNWIVMVEKNDEKIRTEILNSLIGNIIICIIVFMAVISVTKIFLRNYQNDLEAAALKDKLTGLYNRHALDIVFEDLFNRLDRDPIPVCMLLLDIDHFKQFNDQFGHLLGDEILKQVALIIKEKLRASDIVCRWGGEEFLVIVEKVDMESAHIMAENIRKSIESSVIQVDDVSHSVTVSVGLGQFVASDTQDSIIDRVDKALYKSKKHGRNQVTTDTDADE